MWTLPGFGAAQVLRLGSNVVLSRFIDPGVFGILLLVLTFIGAVGLFCDLGLPNAIIQNRRGDDERFLNTAWTMQVVRGFFIWFVLLAIAVPAAKFYSRPELKVYLPACGFIAVIAGLNSTSIYSLNRHLAARTVTLMNLLSQIVSIVVMLTWVVIHPTIWAVVAGQLAGPAVYMVVSHFLGTGEFPHRRVRNRFQWDAAAARDLLHFGKWIFLCTMLFYLQTQVDKLVFDKWFHNIWIFGLYGVALQLMQLPQQVIANLVNTILLPALSKNAQRIDSYKIADSRDRILEARRLILPAGAAATLGVLLGAPLFFQFLYKPTYYGAGTLTQFIAPGAWFAVLQMSVDRAFQMANRLRPLVVANAVNLCFTVTGAIVGAKYGYVNGFVLGLGAGNLAGNTVIELAFLREKIHLFRQDLLYTLLVAGLGAIGLLVPRLFSSSPHTHQVVKVVLAFVIVGSTCLWAGNRVLRHRSAR
jgi:O-antigen/teichoic acid export membrane protein